MRRQRRTQPGPAPFVRRWTAYLPYLVLAVFVVLLAAGLALGEFRTVLANAVTICLSCIGIQ